MFIHVPPFWHGFLSHSFVSEKAKLRYSMNLYKQQLIKKFYFLINKKKLWHFLFCIFLKSHSNTISAVFAHSSWFALTNIWAGCVDTGTPIQTRIQVTLIHICNKKIYWKTMCKSIIPFFHSQFSDTCNMCTSLAQPYHQNIRVPAIHSYIHSSKNHVCFYKFRCSDMDSVHIHFDLLH